MKVSESSEFLNKTQQLFLVIFALVLAIGLFLFRINLSNQKPLEQIARKSLTPEVALVNGKPTIFEFYADWCEACKEMSPAIVSLEKQYSKDIDFVLLNVDNPTWEDLIQIYNVKGIPQINFFGQDGLLLGQLTGLRTKEELSNIINSMAAADFDCSLSLINSGKKLSKSNHESLIETPEYYNSGPRSHG
tara:strand:- start:256 stop:825 length:570 start_codon:yes stop_codon:yes gene_type:complete